MIYEYEALVNDNWQGKTEVLRERPALGLKLVLFGEKLAANCLHSGMV
jgi:hypothetical protein